MVRIGHRGAAGHAPENTVQAIEKAIALGADSWNWTYAARSMATS
jgi:glycerophosphoryl diester phosphodiesterase